MKGRVKVLFEETHLSVQLQVVEFHLDLFEELEGVLTSLELLGFLSANAKHFDPSLLGSLSPWYH